MVINPTEPIYHVGDRGPRIHQLPQREYANLTTVALKALEEGDPRIEDALKNNATGLYTDIFKHHIPEERWGDRLTKAIGSNDDLREYIKEHFEPELRQIDKV